MVRIEIIKEKWNKRKTEKQRRIKESIKNEINAADSAIAYAIDTKKMNNRDYIMIKRIMKKYFQQEIDSIKLGDYLLKDSFPTIVNDITENVRERFIGSVEGIIMCYKNGLLYEEKLAHIVEDKRIKSNEL